MVSLLANVHLRGVCASNPTKLSQSEIGASGIPAGGRAGI
jgi:hypothetical protein